MGWPSTRGPPKLTSPLVRRTLRAAAPGRIIARILCISVSMLLPRGTLVDGLHPPRLQVLSGYLTHFDPRTECFPVLTLLKPKNIFKTDLLWKIWVKERQKCSPRNRTIKSAQAYFWACLFKVALPRMEGGHGVLNLHNCSLKQETKCRRSGDGGVKRFIKSIESVVQSCFGRVTS